MMSKRSRCCEFHSENDFYLDNRDAYNLLKLSKRCICGGGQRCPCADPEVNLGFRKGRMNSFPRHTLELSPEQVSHLATHGLYWSFSLAKHGVIKCVGCHFKKENWSTVAEVIASHRNLTTDRSNYFMCGYLGAKLMNLNTEVPIIYNHETHTTSLPFEKHPTESPNDFDCDPRDLRYRSTCSTDDGMDCGRFEPGLPGRNVGTYTGRYNSYPKHSIAYVGDIRDLVDAGFYWRYNRTATGLLVCLWCKVEIDNWRSGMNAVEEHHVRSPSCEWLFHRDMGCCMDVEVAGRDRMTYKPWRCIVPHMPQTSERLVPLNNDLGPIEYGLYKAESETGTVIVTVDESDGTIDSYNDDSNDETKIDSCKDNWLPWIE